MPLFPAKASLSESCVCALQRFQRQHSYTGTSSQLQTLANVRDLCLKITSEKNHRYHRTSHCFLHIYIYINIHMM